MTRDDLRDALRRAGPFRRWVGLIVRNASGKWRGPVGYVTDSGEPRVRIRTKTYQRCVPIDLRFGRKFNDAHYWHIVYETWVRRMSAGVGDAVSASGFGSDWDRPWVAKRRWWMPAVMAEMEAAFGPELRRRCEEAFLAAMSALDDPEDAALRKAREKWRAVGDLRRAARALATLGCTVEQLRGWADEGWAAGTMKL